MAFEPIFRELKFRNLTVKNRVFRSSINGRWDNYDGSGGQARINWETKFARGGVGAIVSSFVPVAVRGRIVPNYAMIDADDKIPFWRAVGEAVHDHDCRFILQLSHSGRQQDIPGIENQYRRALSSTSKTEGLNGFLSQAMTRDEIRTTVAQFAEGARRARESGLDGVELHSANGYLFTQFFSSAINDRTDEYGGSLENRARFGREVVRAIREKVGDDFHLQFKVSAEDFNNAVYFWETKGDGLAESTQICKWMVEDGVDAIHVSCGNMFPHPRNPHGPFPVDAALKNYETMLSSGIHTHRVYAMLRNPLLRPLFRYLWNRTVDPADRIEGANLAAAREIRKAVRSITTDVPVLCTGGFQTGAKIAAAIERGDCDGVTIARPLIANNDMVRTFEMGEEIPEKLRCSYCNRCALNVLKNPLGCYDLARFDGDYDKMMDQVLSVFRPAAFR